MQKMLLAANKFPNKTALKMFADSDSNIKSTSIDAKRTLKRHIKELQEVQDQMFKLSETKIVLSPIGTD